MKQHVKIVNVDIYNRGVLVFFGSESQLINYVHQRFPCYDDCIRDGLNDGKNGTAYTFKLPADAIIFAGTIPAEKTIVHEIGHVAKHLLSIVEVEDEEAFCYLLEYLYDKIIPWVRTISSSAPASS